MAKVIDYYGDSTIWGYLQGGTRANPTPVQTFASSLTTAETYTVNSKGVSGQGTRRLLGQGSEAWYGGVAPLGQQLSTSSAHICIFNHCLNDADPSQENNSLATYEANLREIVALVRSYGKTVVFETPNPTLNFDIGNYLAKMRSVASELGVAVIEQHQMLMDYITANGLSVASICPDGEHPTQAIYDKKGQNAAIRFKAITEGSGGGSGVTLKPFALPADARIGAMTFQDEFDGTSLDRAKWKLDQIWWNQTPQMDNYRVEGGSLKIWPVSDFRNRDISTDGSFSQKFGYFEVEAKLPYGRGPWPAFWLYGHPGDDRPEIDIMEAYSGGGVNSGWSDSNLHPINYQATLHKANGNYSYHVVPYAPKLMDTYPGVDLSAGFHKYGVLWTATEISFYFDNLKIGTWLTNGDTYFNKELFILLTLQIGGASGNGDATTPLGINNSFEVKYCRAWRLADGSTTVTTNLPMPSGSSGDPSGETPVDTTNFGTYQAGDVFSIKYDGAKVEYRKNGTLLRTKTVATSAALFFDSSFRDPGAKLKSIRLTPLGSNNWADIVGDGKPENYATRGATFDKDIFGKITPSNATTYIANGAILNALIGNIIESVNYVPGVSGWRIDKAGNPEFNNGIFRGTLGANIVNAGNIVSKSATNFETMTRAAPNGTHTFSFYMDYAGVAAITVIVQYAFQNAPAASTVFSGSLWIDSLSPANINGNNFSTSQFALQVGAVLNAGWHTFSVAVNHNYNVGNHSIYALVMRSYR